MNTLLLGIVLVLTNSSFSIYSVSGAPVPQVFGTLSASPMNATANINLASTNGINADPYTTNVSFVSCPREAQHIENRINWYAQISVSRTVVLTECVRHTQSG